MKPDSGTNAPKSRTLLLLAQLSALAYFVLGVAFAAHPTAGDLFLFTVLTPVLAPASIGLFAAQRIAARRSRLAIAPRTRKTYGQPAPMTRATYSD
jgi:hypothetical protein